MPESAVDAGKIIRELRTKDDTEILDEIIEDIEGDDVKPTRRPNPEELGVNTTTYKLKDGEKLALHYPISAGQKEKYCVIYLRIANLLNNGISPNIGIFGKEQRGKSETALTILHTCHNDLNLLHKDFVPENQVLYDVLPFLLFYKYNARVGAMFDEAAETLNKNDYQSKMNRAVAGTIRTQGKKQILNVFVTPEASELDPRIREKLDIEIELTATGKGEITFYERIHGRRAEHKQRRYEFAKVKKDWDIPRAPEHIRNQYDAIDSGFKGRYLDDLIMDAIEEKMEEREENEVMEF